MTLKKKLSLNGLLYIVADEKAAAKLNLDLLQLAKKLAASKADIIQLRAKNSQDKNFLSLAKKISFLAKKKKKIFIINDRADIARLSGANGIHIGSSDIDEEGARKLLGKDSIIGKTIHNQNDFKETKLNLIDYLSLGPFFKSKTKQVNRPPLQKSEIKKIVFQNKKLLFAIGGINRYNVGSVLEYGIKNIALSSAVLSSARPLSEIKELKKCLKKAF